METDKKSFLDRVVLVTGGARVTEKILALAGASPSLRPGRCLEITG